MKRVFAALLIITSVLLSQSAIAQDDKVLLVIEGEEITVDEFMRVYNKNNTMGNVVEKKSVEEYLDLFINFRLKVQQAEELGMDTVQEFKDELENYRQQLARPYLINEDVNNKLMREAYDHMKYDLRASHILIRVEPDASPQDTTIAYNKIVEIRERIKAGESFAKVAVEESEDKSAQDHQQRGRMIPGNKGDIGYFTVFDMVYPFEKAAYKLEKGELSAPVRTRFGYHIIRLTDKIPAIGTVKVAHIMINNSTDSARAANLLDSIRTEIKNGNINWDEAAAKYSDDSRTKSRGGVLPEFTSNSMVPSFIKAVSKLENEGDVSSPVHTYYGTHIVKLISKDVPGTWEEEKAMIKNKISRSDRAQKAETVSARNIREKYKSKIYTKNRDVVIEKVDSNILTNDWDINISSLPDKPVFKIGNRKYSVRDFGAYLAQNQKRDGKGDAKSYAKTVFTQYVDKLTMDYKNERLGDEYPEFKQLLEEYHDGILLFNLMTEKIWSKAMEDTAGLQQFYEKHKTDFMWDKRLHATIFEANTKEAAIFARQLALQGMKPEVIADSVSMVDEYSVAVKTRKFSKDQNKTIGQIKWEKGTTDIREEEGKFIFVDRYEILPPQPKKLNEVRGQVIARYQNYLEEQWIKKLRKKYDFKVNRDALEKIK